MKKFEFYKKSVTVYTMYAEGNKERIGSIAIAISSNKPIIKSSTFSVSKGTLDHVAYRREKASHLSWLVNSLIRDGYLTIEEGEEIILDFDLGFNCPLHPLEYMSGEFDTCTYCLEEWENRKEDAVNE
jgi:hypothetical protein